MHIAKPMPECQHHMPFDSICLSCERLYQSEINQSNRSNTMNAALQNIEPSVSSMPVIGEYWPGQGGVRVATMRGSNGSPDYELILPTDAAAHLGKRAWGKYGDQIEGADHPNDGLANTTAMAAAGNKLAQEVLALEIDGHKDLYLPSRAELAVIRANTPELLQQDDWYWSSTQYSSCNAWYQSFDVGGSDIYRKDRTLRVCAVRRFLTPSTI